jgi:hypothetical protein
MTAKNKQRQRQIQGSLHFATLRVASVEMTSKNKQQQKQKQQQVLRYAQDDK